MIVDIIILCYFSVEPHSSSLVPKVSGSKVHSNCIKDTKDPTNLFASILLGNIQLQNLDQISVMHMKIPKVAKKDQCINREWFFVGGQESHSYTWHDGREWGEENKISDQNNGNWSQTILKKK